MIKDGQDEAQALRYALAVPPLEAPLTFSDREVAFAWMRRQRDPLEAFVSEHATPGLGYTQRDAATVTPPRP